MTLSTDFIASVYDTLVKTLNVEGMSDSFAMQMAWPGYSLTPADFKAPGAPEGPYDVDVALEAFSQISNIVPTFNPTTFENSGFEVDDLYEILVSSAIPIATAGGDGAANPLHRLFNEAQFELMQAKRGSKNDPSRFYYPCVATPVNWYDEAATQTWSSLEIKSSDVKPATPTSPFVKAGGLKLVDKGIMKVSPDIVDEPVLKADVVRLIDARVLPGKPLLARSSASLHVPTPTPTAAALPRRGLQAGVAPSTLALGERLASPPGAGTPDRRTVPVNAFLRPQLKADLQAATLDRQTLSVDPAARIDLNRKLLITELLAQRLPPRPVSPATNGFSISLKYCRVNIARPWLKLALLSMPNWFISSVKAGEYSTGAHDINPGMFPLLPLSFIAIRDLKITANWSSEDRSSLEKSVSFGFFNLRNGVLKQNTFEVKGLQIIAWISRFMPVLPPGEA